ncbi:MAG: hypothetical protein JO032_14030 [Alphaproteobacteria bacterium]|nr:hypothetical protein [Alphaproteobacteria bacterium]
MMLLCDCGGPDKAEKAELVPVGPHAFEYHVETDQFYSPNLEGGAERTRLQWLAADVSYAKLCAGDFEVLSRQVIFQYWAPLGYPVDEIIYRGRCRL